MLLLLLASCSFEAEKTTVDADGDGAASDLDCDDASADVHPGAAESCNQVDDDCDGSVDEGAADASTWFYDADGDGFGDAAHPADACLPPEGYAGQGGDCNDVDAGVNPGAVETCDGADDDCDGLADDADDGVQGASAWFSDGDGDGHGDPESARTACTQPSGTVGTGEDCDDALAAVNPDAAEVCNGVDDDCDGLLDAADDSVSDAIVVYADADGDGYGSTASTACEVGTGQAGQGGDCDDADVTANPGQVETCDGKDDDCDGQTDEPDAYGAPAWYRDGDGDGDGTTQDVVAACAAPSGYVAGSGDCDDADAAVNPAQAEACENGVDDDCDGGSGACLRSGLLAADATLDMGANYNGTLSTLAVEDVTGDGRADVVLASPGDTPYRSGNAFVLVGPVTGSVSAPDYVISGGSNEFAGHGIAVDGSMSGGGSNDVAVGIYGMNTVAVYAGAVRVYYGPITASETSASADVTLTGEGEYDYLGAGSLGGDDFLSLGGDTDGDGFGELLAGCPACNAEGSSAGLVYLVDGTTTGTIAGADAIRLTPGAVDDRLGEAARFVGDPDGDGYDAFVVTAPRQDGGGSGAGTVYLVDGPVTSGDLASAAVTTWTGDGAGDGAGVTLDRVGDTDGDGVEEILVGGYESGAWLVPLDAASGTLGSVALLRIEADGSTTDLGWGAGSGDVDGDGQIDLTLGNGAVTYLVYGPLAGTLALGADADASAADSAHGACLGDIDDDGYADLLTASGAGGSIADVYFGTGL